MQNFPTAKLLLNNKDIVAREIRPTLYSLNGQAMEVPPVIVEANSFQMISLNDWASLGGENFQRGSIKLYHTGKDLNIGTQIYLSDEANSLIFEERLTELGKFDSHRLEGLWGMPSNQTQVRVILSNTSNLSLEVTATLSRVARSSGTPQTFTLLPHQTRVLNLRQDFNNGETFANSSLIGLTLEHSGEKSALKAHGQIRDLASGYSNIISFSNPNGGKSSELHGTGLHVGTMGDEQIAPFIAVKNVGTETTTIQARVPYTRNNGTTGVVNLNSINLQAGEIRLLNTNAVVERSQQENIKIAGIEIRYNTAPGSVIVTAQSVSVSRNQVFRVPMADPLAQVSSTGGYPWRIEETSNTISYIKNMTDLEQEYIASLRWENGGEYMIGLKKIAPHKTVEIDVKRIRDEQIPDFRGRTIPLNITSGQIQWSLRQKYQTNNPQTDQFALIGRSEQIDTINGMSSSYACQNCCSGGDIDGRITVDPSGDIEYSDYEFEAGDVVQFYSFVVHRDCYGEDEYCPISADDWDSSNESIATVSSNGLVTILNAGDVVIDAEIDGFFNLEGSDCPPGGPYLTENCDDKSEQKSAKESKAEEQPPSLAPCGQCDYLPVEHEPEANILATPKVTINVPATAIDGSTVTYSVTVRDGTPTGYQWSFTSPNNAGNNPQVNFTQTVITTSGNTVTATTTAMAHWFANPNNPCASTPPDIDSTHPYYNSKYNIKVRVTFADGSTKEKDKDIKINAWWSPAGYVAPPTITGGYTTALDTSINQYRITADTFQRVVNSPVISVPTTSQFYNKTLRHEEEHVDQYTSGILVNINSLTSLRNALYPLRDTTRAGLTRQITTAFATWQTQQAQALQGLLNQAEIDAYNVSDPLAPMYAYQRCGRTTF